MTLGRLGSMVLVRPACGTATSLPHPWNHLPTTVAHLAFIFCCLVWGTTFILLERVTHVFGPVEIGIWRMLSGAAVVGAFLVGAARANFG